MWSDLKFRLRALLRRDSVERELEEELRFHLERATEKHVGAGLTRAEAERRARIEFGGLEQIAEETRSVRGLAWLETVRQDLRFAFRGVRSRPGFTAAVVVTLGLGIGANTAMFGVVDRLLLRAPAYLEASERVHRVYTRYLWDGVERTERNFAWRTYEYVRESGRGFDVVAAFANRAQPVGSGRASRELPVAAVSASYFDFFDARPEVGRFFTAAEDAVPSGTPVAVLGHGHWQAEYGGRRDVLGERLRIGEVTYTIVGVAAPGFAGVGENAAPIAFVPITTVAYARQPDYAQNFGWSWLEILARREAGVPAEAATAGLTTAFVRSWEAEGEGRASYPTAEEARVAGLLAPVLDARGPDAPPDAAVALWVLGVAAIVLLIAAANVVNLLLARALDRRREIAVRLALGVSRARLAQQLLVETLVLALLGGAAGLLAARWGGTTLRALFLRGEGAELAITDSRTLLFTAAMTLAAALLTGLAPALQALRADVAGTLKAGARGSSRRLSGGRAALLLVQGALCVMLLVGAGLFVRSLLNVNSLRLGYDAGSLMFVDLNLRGVELTDDAGNALADRLVAAATSVPGVISATPISSVPFYSTEGRGAPRVPGRDSLNLLGRYTLQSGSTDYFATTGTRILRGRGFEPGDVPGAPTVVVISRSMAEAIWPDEDPLGKQMRFGGEDAPMLTVVGVAEDITAGPIGGDPAFWYYLPAAQSRAIFGPSRGNLFARVQGRAEDYAEAVRERLQRELPGDAYVMAAPFSALLEPQQRSWRLGATMFAVFAALALVIAAVGLYSVAAYSVAQRTRELGIRVALGARASDVLRMIVGQAVLFAAISILAGGTAAWAAGSRIQPLLFRVSPTDPFVFGSVAAVLLGVALLATARPALRAARIDPVQALRAD